MGDNLGLYKCLFTHTNTFYMKPNISAIIMAALIMVQEHRMDNPTVYRAEILQLTYQEGNKCTNAQRSVCCKY